MTRSLLTLVCFITLYACVNHDLSPDPIEVACKQCGKSKSEMQWLQSLIESAKADTPLMGDIYAVPFGGRTIFLHQPMVMSCVACVLYDCEGNRIDASTIDIQQFMKNVNSSTRIYTPFPG